MGIEKGGSGSIHVVVGGEDGWLVETGEIESKRVD